MGMPDLVIPVSDSQAYRQLGHSVAPPLVEDLADFIMAQPLDPTGQNATSTKGYRWTTPLQPHDAVLDMTSL